MTLIQKQKILDFIQDFTDNNKKTELILTFTQGYCYYFCEILAARFFEEAEHCEFYYNPVIGHFATYIDGHLYDVTGELTMDSKWTSWDYLYLEDDLLAKRIVRDCIKKERNNE